MPHHEVETLYRRPGLFENLSDVQGFVLHWSILVRLKKTDSPVQVYGDILGTGGFSTQPMYKIYTAPRKGLTCKDLKDVMAEVALGMPPAEIFYPDPLNFGVLRFNRDTPTLVAIYLSSDQAQRAYYEEFQRSRNVK